MEQEPHTGNKGNSHLACFVDAESCTSPEFIVSTGSAPGPKSRGAKSKRPVVFSGAPHLRKKKLLLKSPCPNLAETL